MRIDPSVIASGHPERIHAYGQGFSKDSICSLRLSRNVRDAEARSEFLATDCSKKMSFIVFTTFFANSTFCKFNFVEQYFPGKCPKLFSHMYPTKFGLFLLLSPMLWGA